MKAKLIHAQINDDFLLSIAPRAGYHTFLGMLSVFENLKYTRIRDIRKVHAFKGKKIKFIRNPYERAVSTFFMVPNKKLVGNIGKPFNMEWKDVLNLSFYRYLQKLNKCSLKHLNPHVGFQREIGENSNFKYDEFFKIEEIENKIQEIASYIKCDVDPSKSFGTRHKWCKERVDVGFCGALPLGKVRSRKNRPAPHYKCFYNNKVKKLARKVFKEDFHGQFYDIKCWNI
jgi:hypothetical protein